LFFSSLSHFGAAGRASSLNLTLSLLLAVRSAFASSGIMLICIRVCSGSGYKAITSPLSFHLRKTTRRKKGSGWSS